MDRKLKYIRLISNEIIIFPPILNHSDFKHLIPVSAGFCYIVFEEEKVDCFGESISLGLKSDSEKDTLCATRLIFGLEAMLHIASNKN